MCRSDIARITSVAAPFGFVVKRARKIAHLDVFMSVRRHSVALYLSTGKVMMLQTYNVKNLIDFPFLTFQILYNI